jgi:hypothetical protein
VRYLNDGDVAPGATVVVEAVAPDGVVAPGVPLADMGGGSYEAVLSLPAPGTWTLRTTATTPTAMVEVAYVAGSLATTTPRRSGSDDGRSNPGPGEAAGGGSSDADSDEGSDAPVVVIFVIAILVVAVLAIGAGRRWKQRTEDPSID